MRGWSPPARSRMRRRVAPREINSVVKPPCWSGPRCVRDLRAVSITPRGKRLRTCVYPRMPHIRCCFLRAEEGESLPLRRTHVCDLIDRPERAPVRCGPISHTHAVFFPTWLQRCRDYTRKNSIAKQKIKNCKVG